MSADFETEVLEALRDRRLDIERARGMPHLNHALDSLITRG